MMSALGRLLSASLLLPAPAAAAVVRLPVLGPQAGLPVAAAPSAGDAYDAVVVGSGFGGSVAALRLSQAGLKVAVLERGPRRGFGDFPRGEQAQWNPEKGRFGAHELTELDRRVVAWSGSGLGGGSLVYASILLRKALFEGWPGGITAEELAPYYSTVEEMMDAAPYPVDAPGTPYRGTEKTRAVIEAARRVPGGRLVLPNLAVRFQGPGEPEGARAVNRFGAVQEGCRACGECSLPGCNHGAKNSLDKNYLAEAERRHGAAMLVGREADRIEPLPGGGYAVHSRDPLTGEETRTRAKVVVLAAGSLGSTRLLLRNKLVHRTLPGLSPALGSRFTTNGNFIGFALGADEPLRPERGPEITAGLEFRGKDGRPQGFHVFDGSYRRPWSIVGKLAGLPTSVAEGLEKGLGGLEDLGALSTEGTLPLLVLGRDRAVGRLSLDPRGDLATDLDPRRNKDYYRRAEAAMRRMARAWGGTLLPFPLWHLQRKIEVPHPLGGVPMGDSPLDGVVDDAGRVYGYDGLVVLDGSIIPESLGVNPALTIAALAERAAERIVEQLRREGRVSAESR